MLRQSLCRMSFLFAGCLAVMSCESLPPLAELVGTNDPTTEAEDEEQRRQFVQGGSADALRRLLGHRVRQGMTRGEVAAALGSPGLREFNDERFKLDGSGYQVGDETYKWGPDRKGQSYYLMFRDGKLVNYDAAEFQN